MSNLAKLDFTALDISGRNYLSWILDAEIHLDAKKLGETIKEGNKASMQERAMAMIFIRHHIHEDLKSEYLTIKDPSILWKNLKERFEHQRTIILPRARDSWSKLKLSDYKSVTEYNSALFRISSQMNLCGEPKTDVDMLEKTFTTFHPSNLLLQQQYRERHFTKYSELISCLLVAEQNNELLLQNHISRPTGSDSLNETHAASFNGRGRGRGRFRGRGRGYGCGSGRGHGRNNNYGGYHSVEFPKRNYTPYYHEGNASGAKQEKLKGVPIAPSKQYEDVCFRCGMTGHWFQTCRTPKYFVELYEASLKGKGKEKEIETNTIEKYEPMAINPLDISDFYEDLPENNNQWTNDGNVHTD